MDPVDMARPSEDGFNETDGLFAIADGLRRVARAIEWLGNAGAVSVNGHEIGAIENLAMETRDGFRALAEVIETLHEGSES